MRPLGGGLEHRVHLGHRHLAAQQHHHVADAAHRSRNPQTGAVELALQLGIHLAHGLGRARAGRNDVDGGGARPAQIAVRQVQHALIVGVAVYRGHDGLLDAEGLVNEFHWNAQGIGGAAGVGDDVVLGRVVILLVDAQHDGEVLILGRGRDDDFLRPARDVLAHALTVGEDAGALDHQVHAHLAPLQVGGVALGQRPDGFPVHVQVALVVGHGAVELSGGAVVFEQVRQGLVIGQVVDGDHVDAALGQNPEDQPPDPSKSVDAYLHGAS